MFNNLKELLDFNGFESPYQFGRMLYKYTDCGPWTVFIAPKGKEIYYEDKLAQEKIPKCVGIKIGSIVEGSDVEVDPITLKFPFSKEDLDKAVKEINATCSFYWERDNSDWFKLRYSGAKVGVWRKGKTYWFHWTWDEVIWDGDKPKKKVKDAVNAFHKTGGNMTWNGALGIQTNADGEWFPLGLKGWEVMQYNNDGCY
jgi:hypothetical protein